MIHITGLVRVRFRNYDQNEYTLEAQIGKVQKKKKTEGRIHY